MSDDRKMQSQSVREVPSRVYLGDGVYVAFDEYGLTLTTENGIEATNTIYLEPSVYAALVQYVAGLQR